MASVGSRRAETLQEAETQLQEPSLSGKERKASVTSPHRQGSPRCSLPDHFRHLGQQPTQCVPDVKSLSFKEIPVSKTLLRGGFLPSKKVGHLAHGDGESKSRNLKKSRDDE